jgi:nucleoside kinase
MDDGGRDRPRELLVAGHVNIDRFLRLDRFPDDDRTVPVERHRVALGGTAGNIALAASRFGVRAGLFARIGRDFPVEFRTRLSKARIDLRGLSTIPDRPSPTAYVMEDRRGRQRTLMDQGAMDDAVPPEKGPPAWLPEYSWAHITTGPPAVQLALLEAATRAHVHVAADPAQEVHYRWTPRALERLLARSEILFGNRSEIARIASMLDRPRIDALVDVVPLIVRTEGRAGATALTRTGEVHVPAVRPRRVRSVVGAGDGFRGGFYAAWFRGEELTGCLRAGVRSASRAMEGTA